MRSSDSTTIDRADWPTPLVVAALLSFSLAAGTLGNLVHPARLPWTGATATPPLPEGVRIIALSDALARVQAGTTIMFDARSAAEYDRGHLPGAISLPAAESLADWIGVIKHGEVVVTYCTGPSCDDAIRLATRLREQTGAQVEVFAGGFAAWAEAGLPMEGK